MRRRTCELDRPSRPLRAPQDEGVAFAELALSAERRRQPVYQRVGSVLAAAVVLVAVEGHRLLGDPELHAGRMRLRASRCRRSRAG